jgi:tripartite-type tricarboxylate transporter receptor subunit TctC
MMKLFSPMLGMVLCAAAIAQDAALADPVADFYRGRTLELAIGAAPAGGYDVAGRTLANHMARYIPGNPAIIVRNMPGATGLIMTNYLYGVAKRDGTAIGMPTSNIPLEPRLKLVSADGSNVKFDLRRFSWIGTPLQEPQVTWVWHTTPARTFADLKTNTVLMGATTSSADNALLPSIVNQLLGTKMQVFAGYIGQNEINLAVERGEVQGNNTGLSNLTVNKTEWLRDNKIRILLQFGTERLAVLKDVPTVAELATSDADRALLRFYGLKFKMARPLIIPPNVPAERTAALQAAFEATMRDPQYLDEAKRIGLDTNWLGAGDMAEIMRQIEETPQPVVDQLRALLSRADTRQSRHSRKPPPDLPAERVGELRAAFDAMMANPNLLAEASRQSLDVDPVSGTEMQALVDRLYRAPPEVVDLVQKINADH